MTIGIPAILLILFLHIIITDMKISLKDVAFSFLGIMYIISFAMFIPLIYGLNQTSGINLGSISISSETSAIDNIFNQVGKINGKYLIWFLMMATWGSDIFAYLIGRHFGKHKFSKVSPNKTIEGCTAGVVAAVILSLIYTYCLNTFTSFELSYITMGIIGAISCVIGQIGDFAASSIKRHFDVKDFSDLFPGHGGVIDRIDSVIFAAPFAFILFVLVL